MSCEYCRQNPHHPRCPEADPEPVVCECSVCGEDIYEGEYYYDIDSIVYCCDCMDEFKKYAEFEVEDYGSDEIGYGRY